MIFCGDDKVLRSSGGWEKHICRCEYGSEGRIHRVNHNMTRSMIYVVVRIVVWSARLTVC